MLAHVGAYSTRALMPLPTCEPVHMRSIRRIRLAVLRVRRERPCYCRAAEERDELAALHVWMALAWQEIIWRTAQGVCTLCPQAGRSGLLGDDVRHNRTARAPAGEGHLFSPRLKRRWRTNSASGRSREGCERRIDLRRCCQH